MKKIILLTTIATFFISFLNAQSSDILVKKGGVSCGIYNSFITGTSIRLVEETHFTWRLEVIDVGEDHPNHGSMVVDSFTTRRIKSNVFGSMRNGGFIDWKMNEVLSLKVVGAVEFSKSLGEISMNA